MDAQSHTNEVRTGTGRQHRAQLTLDTPARIAAVHELVSAWEDRAAGWELVRLGLHEWTANLIQHADFRAQTPRMTLQVRSSPQHICAVVEDNSTGFTFHAVPDADFGHLPERGMGLTLLRICAEKLRYCRRDAWNRLAFVVDAMRDPAFVRPNRRAS